MIYAVTYGGPTDALIVAGVRIPRGETREVDITAKTADAVRGMRHHTTHLAPAGALHPSPVDDEPAIPDPDDDPGSTEEDTTDAAP